MDQDNRTIIVASFSPSSITIESSHLPVFVSDYADPKFTDDTISDMLKKWGEV